MGGGKRGMVQARGFVGKNMGSEVGQVAEGPVAARVRARVVLMLVPVTLFTYQPRGGQGGAFLVRAVVVGTSARIIAVLTTTVMRHHLRERSGMRVPVSTG